MTSGTAIHLCFQEDLRAAHLMNAIRLVRGTQRSKKAFMLDDASTLLLAHNCRHGSSKREGVKQHESGCVTSQALCTTS